MKIWRRSPKNGQQSSLYQLRMHKISDPDIIRIPLVTQVEHDGQTSVKKKKKKEEVQNIETDEEDNASEESRPDSPTRGGGDEVNQEEGGEEGENNDKGKVTPPKDPPTEVRNIEEKEGFSAETLSKKEDPCQ
jgi:hypothetical protein